MKQILAGLIIIALVLLSGCARLSNDIEPQNQQDSKEKSNMTYTMPAENSLHEGTWLIWPHPYTYGIEYQKEIEDIWIQMTLALHRAEKVHIIAYDKKEEARIEKMLLERELDMRQIDFVIAKSDDVWVRDTGPIFVLDKNKRLTIADFGFNEWGEKTEFKHDDQIPMEVGIQKGIHVVDVAGFVLEGGAIEIDGSGTVMASRSSVVSKNRNQGISIKQAEDYLSIYLGATNFIWLDGVIGEDITDAHIDGMARFLDNRTILTVSEDDFLQLYEGISIKDYDIIRDAKNAIGKPYEIVELPLTKKNVKGLAFKGSYLNYYIGNEVVFVPVYKDANDTAALKIIAELYPDKKIVPIMVNALFKYGGMIHCVTQQQPQSK